MKSPQKKIEEKLWKECRRIIFKKYGNTCYTCGANNLEGANLQLGHCIPRSVGGAFLRYDLRNLRPQCFRCNIHGGGCGAFFVRNLTEEIGKKAVDQMFKDKQKIVKAINHYSKLLKEYESL
jgi:hypothetical protein